MGITIQNILLFLLILVVGKGLESLERALKFIYELKVQEKFERERQRNAQTGPTHNQTRW